MGSSVGISKVKSYDLLITAIEEALMYDVRIVVEKGLERPREVELAVLGNDEPMVSIAGEITPDSKHEFYSYESKYTDGGADLHIPANISDEQLTELQ
jgi:D-alanine-D-alanine ligase